MFIAAGYGAASAARYQAAVGKNWYNPNVVSASRNPPATPLSNQSTLAELFPLMSDDAFVHITPSPAAKFSGGANPGAFFFRFGDVKGLTVTQLRGAVGPLAPGGSNSANNFVFVEPTVSSAKAFEPVGAPVMGRFQEFILRDVVEPTHLGQVNSSE